MVLHSLKSPRRKNPFLRPGGGLVSEAAPVASGVVPVAIAAFFEASRTEWSQVAPRGPDPTAFDDEEPTVRGVARPERAPALRDMRSDFADHDPRLAFFDAVDAPVAEWVADIALDEAPEPEETLELDEAPVPTGKLTLVRTLPAPRKVVPMAGVSAEVPRLAAKAAPASRRGPLLRMPGVAPLGLAASALLAVLAGGVLLQGASGAGPQTAALGQVRSLPQPPTKDVSAFASMLGRMRDLWGGNEPVVLTEVDTPAGEMVALEPGFGVVEIVVGTDADVWIDGGPRGVVMGTGLFTLPSGDHDIELRSGGIVQNHSVDVGDGEAVRLEMVDEGSG